MLSLTMISCIKYISPALIFNNNLLKSYKIIFSSLYLIQLVIHYVEIINNKLNLSFLSIFWFNNNSLIVNISYNNKSSSVIMLFIIGLISTYIILYSFNYMIGDSHYYEFYIILECFIFSMNLLVLSNNMIIIFFSWELVGLCSYCLISFWKLNFISHNSSMKAVL